MGSCHASVHIVLTSAVLGTSKAGCLPGSINQDIPYVWINLAVTQRHHAWKKKNQQLILLEIEMVCWKQMKLEI